MNADDISCLVDYWLREHYKCRLKQRRVVHRPYDMADDRLDLSLRNANHLAVIRHAKEDVAAKTIQERAYRLKRVVLRAVSATLELNADMLADLQDVFKLFRCHC